MVRCHAKVSKSGRACKAAAMANSDYCWSHQHFGHTKTENETSEEHDISDLMDMDDGLNSASNIHSPSHAVPFSNSHPFSGDNKIEELMAIINMLIAKFDMLEMRIEKLENHGVVNGKSVKMINEKAIEKCARFIFYQKHKNDEDIGAQVRGALTAIDRRICPKKNGQPQIPWMFFKTATDEKFDCLNVNERKEFMEMAYAKKV